MCTHTHTCKHVCAHTHTPWHVHTMCTHAWVHKHIYNKIIKNVSHNQEQPIKECIKTSKYRNQNHQRKKTLKKKKDNQMEVKATWKKTDAECTKKAEMNLRRLVSTICHHGCESLVRIQRLSEWSFTFPSLNPW